MSGNQHKLFGFSPHLVFMGFSLFLGIGLTLLLIGVNQVAARSAPVKVGLIPEISGIHDKSFNEASFQGLMRAQSQLGIVGTVYTTTTENDYGPKIVQCAQEGNDLCIGVGYAMHSQIANAAGLFPQTKFSIVDVQYDTYPANLRGLTFASKEAGYLAGVLAGKMTQSNKVAAVGGMIIPAVDDYITGYRNGASCANPSAITLVRYTNDFGNPQLGAQVAQELIQAGADVLFAVAGPTGSGVLITATQSGAWGIGVDVDQFFTVFQGGAQPGAYHLLTSAIKLIDNAVYDTISDVVSSTFTAGTALYGLAEQGVELAPYHLTDASIPQAVKDEVAQVRQEIIQGTRDVNQLCDSAMLKVGMIPGTGGINDNGFNENSYAGLLRAQSELGVVGTVYELGDPPDFAATIEQCVMEGNKLCIGVGFELGAPVEEAANTFTQTKFATLDVEYGVYSPNLRGILFASEEPGYLAGVLAGEMTESNRIGAIGGMKIPPVDRFIDGYRNGASCANPFVTTVVSYTNDFTNPELGEQFARQMLDSGADVLFPVAGPTGEGALITTTQSGAWAIGVDVDQFNSVFQGGSVAGADHLLTSVLKRLDNAVYNTISDVISGTFGAGTLTYHLADGGVGLAPYHLADAAIPGSVKLQVDQAQMRIIQGLIDVNQPCDRRLFLPALMRINP